MSSLVPQIGHPVALWVVKLLSEEICSIFFCYIYLLYTTFFESCLFTCLLLIHKYVYIGMKNFGNQSYPVTHVTHITPEKLNRLSTFFYMFMKPVGAG